VSRSSSNDEDLNSSNSDTRKFEDEHGIKSIPLRHKTRDKLIIKVQDSGIGIKRQDQLKLFRLFGKLQNTKGMNTQGIGLGLVISDNIVNQFGGKIGVKSKYKQGSTFMFSVLLGREEDYKDKQNRDVALKPGSNSYGIQTSSEQPINRSMGSVERIHSIAITSMSFSKKTKSYSNEVDNSSKDLDLG